jgi:tRNA-dihydrouridine synthase
MAGITDSAMRRICRSLGATATVTEMVSAAGLSRRSVKTSRLLLHTEEERPLGVQLFGHRPEDFHRAAGLVEDLGFDFIDINAGCPVRRVASKGSGAGLLRDLPALLRIVESTVRATELPVTVKLRLGWSGDEPLESHAARGLAEAGAAAIAVHGRFRFAKF